jgi:hypothetical protein
MALIGPRRGHRAVMFAIATAADRQIGTLIGCKKRREQRKAEQRNQQQCDHPAHRQIKYDTDRLLRSSVELRDI